MELTFFKPEVCSMEMDGRGCSVLGLVTPEDR